MGSSVLHRRVDKQSGRRGADMYSGDAVHTVNLQNFRGIYFRHYRIEFDVSYSFVHWAWASLNASLAVASKYARYHFQSFWESARLINVDEDYVIEANVLGQAIRVTEADIRRVLQFGGEPAGMTLIPERCIKGCFLRIRYFGVYSQPDATDFVHVDAENVEADVEDEDSTESEMETVQVGNKMVRRLKKRPVQQQSEEAREEAADPNFTADDHEASRPKKKKMMAKVPKKKKTRTPRIIVSSPVAVSTSPVFISLSTPVTVASTVQEEASSSHVHVHTDSFVQTPEFVNVATFVPSFMDATTKENQDLKKKIDNIQVKDNQAEVTSATSEHVYGNIDDEEEDEKVDYEYSDVDEHPSFNAHFDDEDDDGDVTGVGSSGGLNSRTGAIVIYDPSKISFDATPISIVSSDKAKDCKDVDIEDLTDMEYPKKIVDYSLPTFVDLFKLHAYIHLQKMFVEISEDKELEEGEIVGGYSRNDFYGMFEVDSDQLFDFEQDNQMELFDFEQDMDENLYNLQTLKNIFDFEVQRGVPRTSVDQMKAKTYREMWKESQDENKYIIDH
ncbi:hypothetical protein R6Q59_013565 [Mikania micrantha]